MGKWNNRWINRRTAPRQTHRLCLGPLLTINTPKEGISQYMEQVSKPTLNDRGNRTAPIIIERQYLTIKEVSLHTGLAVGTLYNMVHQRRIPHRKLGRLVKFERYELDKWLKEQSRKVCQSRAA